MSNTLIIVLSAMVGLIGMTNAWAQDNEDKKKPSWSTGLPERKSAPIINTPSSEMAKPTFEIEQPGLIELPESDLAVPAGLQQKFELPEIIIDNSASEDIDESVDYEDIDLAQLHNYSWEILAMEPVKIPKTLSFSNQEVMLEISINPQGEVVKVQRVNDRTSNKILNYANTAIKQWRFKPPAAVGINAIISKIMRIELLPR